MSPATRSPAPESDTAPLETTSPLTFSVPAPAIVRALPPAPPHPAWSSAATAGVKRRLLTPPDAAPVTLARPPRPKMRDALRQNRAVRVGACRGQRAGARTSIAGAGRRRVQPQVGAEDTCGGLLGGGVVPGLLQLVGRGKRGRIDRRL